MPFDIRNASRVSLVLYHGSYYWFSSGFDCVRGHLKQEQACTFSRSSQQTFSGMADGLKFEIRPHRCVAAVTELLLFSLFLFERIFFPREAFRSVGVPVPAPSLLTRSLGAFHPAGPQLQSTSSTVQVTFHPIADRSKAKRKMAYSGSTPQGASSATGTPRSPMDS